MWDLRSRFSSETLNNIYQVTAVCFNNGSELVMTGGLDNMIKVQLLNGEAVKDCDELFSLLDMGFT